MDTKARELLQKFDYLEEQRKPVEPDWKEITRFVLPRRDIWEEKNGRGGRTGGEIFDGTAISAVNLAAHGIIGYMMSPLNRWFKLGLESDEALELPGVRVWLEYIEEVLYADFAQSNLYEEGVEFFKDLLSIATATMYTEEDTREKLPYFSTRHTKEIYLDADRRGKIDTLFRVYYMTARTMEQAFGKNNLPHTIQLALEREPYERYPVIHAVFPRTDRDVTSLSSNNKRFASIYLDRSSGEILREGGYDDFPYIVGRWSTNSDEVYGRGPAHDAIVKIKRANAMAKDFLTYSQLAADPPWNIPEHMRDDVHIVPHGLNYFATPNDIAQPAYPGGRFELAIEQEQEVRRIIEEDFLVDFFVMLQRAPEGMTATEVMERQSEKAAVLGPIIGRIESEVLDQVIDKAFRVAVNAGKIPPPPPALQMLPGMQVKVEYIGALAQANKKFHMQQGIQHSLQSFVPVLEVYPQLRGLVKAEDLGRKLLQSTGMPADVVRDRREFKEWEVQMQRQQQALEQRQAQMEAMQNADKLGKKPEAGSPMDMIDQQLRGQMQTMQGGVPQ